MKMYICVLEEFPDFMTPTLVAHSVLWAHQRFEELPDYQKWLNESFRKVVLRVTQKEFDKIKELPNVCLGHELNTLGGKDTSIVVCPVEPDKVAKVLKFAKMWKPQENS